MNRTILRKADMQQIFGGCSVTTIDRMEKAGYIPQRVKINPAGGRIVGWYSDEVEAAQAELRQRGLQYTADTTKIGKGRPGPGRPRKQPAQAA
jgi:predicted DNA-binding transcriptional regulator AlpA